MSHYHDHSELGLDHHHHRVGAREVRHGLLLALDRHRQGNLPITRVKKPYLKQKELMNQLRLKQKAHLRVQVIHGLLQAVPQVADEGKPPMVGLQNIQKA